MVRVGDGTEHVIIQEEIAETDIGDDNSELAGRWFGEKPS